MLELNGTPQSRASFVQWVRSRHPNLYRQVMLESGTLGDISETLSKVFGTIRDTVLTLGPAYIQTKAEIELLKLNIARAKQGQMPVNSLPDAAAQVPAVRNGSTAATGANLPGWLIPVAIGVVALLFLRR